MKHWIERPMPCASWAKLAAAVLVGLSACAPAAPRGPEPSPLPAREPTVRVGLAVDTTRVTLESTTTLEVRDGATGGTVLTASPGQTVTVESTSAGRISLSGAGADASAGTHVVANATGDGFLRINGSLYRGDAVVRATGPGRLTAINEVGMENYLLGVVPYEIGRVGPELLQAAKAQAVAARTYAIRYLGRREALGFDVFATVDDQVYGGADGEHEPITRAVLETAGEILTFRGEPIEAFYHSTCAGQTAAIEEVWPTENPRPYLVSVVDRHPETGEAFDSTSSRFRWTQRWTINELSSILERTLADSLPVGTRSVGEIQDFEIRRRTPSGRISEMLIHTAFNTFGVGRDRIRWIFLTPEGRILNSSRFDIRTERDPRGRITAVIAEGAGWGHGIGMCQVGAMGRARAGQDYRTILPAYYPRTDLTKLY
ncbi:MAG TPA: SpoIID/LytB domain-containing protein [Longimicrobiaceae bacterium]|nr:SpoIID/LytB domain-containing protein [Longimicrobiaceae bacterium]